MLVGASGQAGHPALARDERFRVLWLISGLMTGPTFSFPSFVGGKFHNCVHILPVHHVSSCTWLLASLYEQRGRPLLFYRSVSKSCTTLGDPTHRRMSGPSVLHHLLEFAQIHVHRVGDAIQTSRSLSSPSPPSFNLSQHQGLFQWVRGPKYWSFSFSISPSNEYSGLF